MQVTTYKVFTTINASGLADEPVARHEAARAAGYSVAQLGPGSASGEDELLETWMLLEVGGHGQSPPDTPRAWPPRWAC